MAEELPELCVGRPKVVFMHDVLPRFLVKQGTVATLCGASGAGQTSDSVTLCRYYGANAPVYQVDILDTNTMTFHGGELISLEPTPSAHTLLLLVKARWEAFIPQEVQQLHRYLCVAS